MTSGQLARRCRRTRRHCLILAVMGRPHSERSSNRAWATLLRALDASTMALIEFWKNKRFCQSYCPFLLNPSGLLSFCFSHLPWNDHLIVWGQSSEWPTVSWRVCSVFSAVIASQLQSNASSYCLGNVNHFTTCILFNKKCIYCTSPAHFSLMATCTNRVVFSRASPKLDNSLTCR